MTKALRRLGGEETDVVIRVTFAAFQVPYRGNRLAAATRVNPILLDRQLSAREQAIAVVSNLMTGVT